MGITPWYIEIERKLEPFLDSKEHCPVIKTIKNACFELFLFVPP